MIFGIRMIKIILSCLCVLQIASSDAVFTVNSSIPKEFNYKQTHLGKVPYGSKKVLQLYALGIENESGLSSGCEQYISPQPSDAKQNFAILLRRGNCKFQQKLQNAQNAGASLVILAMNDTQSLDNKAFVYPGNRHYLRQQRQIPMIAIVKEEGDELLQIIKSETELGHKPLNLTIDFKYFNQDFLPEDLPINVTVFLEANNRKSYRFLTDVVKPFHQFSSQLKNFYGEPLINFELTYGVFECPTCNSQYCFDDDKKLCMMKEAVDNVYVDNQSEGSQQRNHSILQYLMFEVYADSVKLTEDQEKSRNWFWSYIQQIDRNCIFIRQDFQRCTHQMLTKVMGQKEASHFIEDLRNSLQLLKPMSERKYESAEYYLKKFATKRQSHLETELYWVEPVISFNNGPALSFDSLLNFPNSAYSDASQNLRNLFCKLFDQIQAVHYRCSKYVVLPIGKGQNQRHEEDFTKSPEQMNSFIEKNNKKIETLKQSISQISKMIKKQMQLKTFSDHWQFVKERKRNLDLREALIVERQAKIQKQQELLKELENNDF